MFLRIRAIRRLTAPATRVGLPLPSSLLPAPYSTIRNSTIALHASYQRYRRLSTASLVKVVEEEKADSRPLSDSPQQEQSNNTSSSIEERLPAWLRPYQVQVIAECMKALDGGLQRIGVSSPTGSGKTVMFTHLIPLLLERGSFRGGSVLVLVGNIELARQAYQTIRSSFPDYTVELEQGTSTASGSADVTIATYQTLRQDSRLAKFNPARFKGIIVDEAHHAAAPSYIKLLSYFNAGVKSTENSNPPPPSAPTADQTNVPIIGFTATFSRHDQLALSRVFQEIVYHQDVIDMLEAGWLSPARFTTVRVDLKLSKVAISSTTDDYSATSLAEVMNTDAMNDLIVRVYLDRAGDRKSTLIFCVDLAHVADMTAAFRRAGVDARFVTGNTKESQRKALVEAFKAGEFPVMVNCQLFTEGTDIPNIDCIIVARPTRSRNLFSQMIGRGLRHSPGKEDCRIIDLADNVKKVGGLITGPTLFGLDTDAAVDDATVATLKKWAREREELEQESDSESDEQMSGDVSYQEDDDPFRLDDASSKSARGKSRYAWVSCGDNKYVLDAFESEYYSIVRENGLFQIRHTFQLPKEMAKEGKKFSPFRKPTTYGRTETLEAAFRAADALVEKMVPKLRRSTLTRWAPWRRKPASPAQLKWLERMVEKGTANGTIITVKTHQGEDDPDEPVELTCGQITAMLTAMKHGAKGRYEKGSRKNEQAERVKAKEAKRQAAQIVKVGPLGY